MAVMMPRERWTDERLDELNKKVDDGFARVENDIRELRSEMKSEIGGLRSELKSEMKSQGDGLRNEMRELNARFDSLNRTLIGGAAAIVAALIGVNAF
jgi:uncharacterized coiled-coil DUF342 family protein